MVYEAASKSQKAKAGIPPLKLESSRGAIPDKKMAGSYPALNLAGCGPGLLDYMAEKAAGAFLDFTCGLYLEPSPSRFRFDAVFQDLREVAADPRWACRTNLLSAASKCLPALLKAADSCQVQRFADGAYVGMPYLKVLDDKSAWLLHLHADKKEWPWLGPQAEAGRMQLREWMLVVLEAAQDWLQRCLQDSGKAGRQQQPPAALQGCMLLLRHLLSYLAADLSARLLVVQEWLQLVADGSCTAAAQEAARAAAGRREAGGTPEVAAGAAACMRQQAFRDILQPQLQQLVTGTQLWQVLRQETLGDAEASKRLLAVLLATATARAGEQEDEQEDDQNDEEAVESPDNDADAGSERAAAPPTLCDESTARPEGAGEEPGAARGSSQDDEAKDWLLRKEEEPVPPLVHPMEVVDMAQTLLQLVFALYSGADSVGLFAQKGVNPKGVNSKGVTFPNVLCTLEFDMMTKLRRMPTLKQLQALQALPGNARLRLLCLVLADLDHLSWGSNPELTRLRMEHEELRRIRIDHDELIRVRAEQEQQQQQQQEPGSGSRASRSVVVPYMPAFRYLAGQADLASFASRLRGDVPSQRRALLAMLSFTLPLTILSAGRPENTEVLDLSALYNKLFLQLQKLQLPLWLHACLESTGLALKQAAADVSTHAQQICV